MTPIENITFAEALEDYICSKDRLLSPSTVRGYRTMQRSSFDRINDLQISELTEKVIHLPLWRVLAGYYFRSSRDSTVLVYYHVPGNVSRRFAVAIQGDFC